MVTLLLFIFLLSDQDYSFGCSSYYTSIERFLEGVTNYLLYLLLLLPSNSYTVDLFFIAARGNSDS